MAPTIPPELTTYRGHILSVYPDEKRGAVIWLVGEDGKRYTFSQSFPTTFYVSGEMARLDAIFAYLKKSKHPPSMVYTFRRELYKGLKLVLRIEVANPVDQKRLFYHLKKRFNHVRFYDANIPFPIRFATTTGVFPMAQCEVVTDAVGKIHSMRALDSPWDDVYDLPELRSLYLAPDADPNHSTPRHILVRAGERSWELSLEHKQDLLIALQRIFNDYDPDIIVAPWGDGYLFQKLMEWAESYGVAFNPNRDLNQTVKHKEGLTYFSYGSVYYRAPQTHLFGRWHVDPNNSAMGGGEDFDLRAAVEMARVTGVAVQTAARNSPGSGFTAMQIGEALRRGVLVPMHKRQVERFKSAMDLNLADSGGLNYRPIVGLHHNVAELDFFSMYPSIMNLWNISGETVGEYGEHAFIIPRTEVPIRIDEPGLVASVLKPLLAKRLNIKKKLKQLDERDPLYPALQSMADGLKWLGYVSFGYQGYKNNLFGNIQAHEAITTIGRLMLTTAISAALDMGFEVLAANTDSLFVVKPGGGSAKPWDFEPLIEEIKARTGLVIELEGIFNWIMFQPQKKNPKVGAANRYFGAFDDGRMKVRGMAQRRTDTPEWIAAAEKEIMGRMAENHSTKALRGLVPEIIGITKRYITLLYDELVPLEGLVVKKKLTKELDEYKGKSEPAKAARQLVASGKEIRVGQRMKLLYVKDTNKPGVYAWDQDEPATYDMIDKERYREMMLRVVHQLVQLLGLSEQDLTNMVLYETRQLRLWSEDEWNDDLDWDWDDEPVLADALFSPGLNRRIPIKAYAGITK